MTVGSGLGRVPIGGAVLLACDLRRVGSVGHGIVGEWWYCTSGVEMPRDVEWRRGRRGSTAWQWGGKAAVCVNATGLLVEVSTKGLFFCCLSDHRHRGSWRMPASSWALPSLTTAAIMFSRTENESHDKTSALVSRA